MSREAELAGPGPRPAADDAAADSGEAREAAELRSTVAERPGASSAAAAEAESAGVVLGPPDPIPDCEARLEAAGVRFVSRSLPIHREHGIECGAPQVVEYRRGPQGIRWSPTPLVSCGLALAMARFETVLVEEAQRSLGATITRVEQGGTYSCRSMARFRQVSEHAYANAIDIRSLQTDRGRNIQVLQHFGAPAREAPTAEGRFLRQLARRAYDDGVFSVVVTRFYDELHRDHIHVDAARYRVDGTR